MASTNIFDLLNDDAQDQEIQIPVVKKDVKPAAAKPAAAATKTAEKAPRKDGARGGKPRDGDDRGKHPDPTPWTRFFFFDFFFQDEPRGRPSRDEPGVRRKDLLTGDKDVKGQHSRVQAYDQYPSTDGDRNERFAFVLLKFQAGVG